MHNWHNVLFLVYIKCIAFLTSGLLTFGCFCNVNNAIWSHARVPIYALQHTSLYIQQFKIIWRLYKDDEEIIAVAVVRVGGSFGYVDINVCMGAE